MDGRYYTGLAMSLYTLTIHELREQLGRGEVTAREATQALLDRIQIVDTKLKAYLWLNPEDAFAQADRIDQKSANLRSAAHHIVLNDSSLEDLRWRVDDGLFEMLHLERK